MKIQELYTYFTQHFLVDTDTRKIRKNSLFFALKGDNFNGNAFAAKALELGAKYAVVDEKKYQTHAHIFLVDNVLKTLQELAAYHRKQLKTTIIGLTGSNGKTTTKELMYAVLSKHYKTVATQGNLNNHIGVPLTLLSITPDTEIGIIEMGANHQKEIEFLSNICAPDYGYITNFGKAHLEGFGGVAGVIKGKSELYDFLEKKQKTAFINPEDTIQVEKTAPLKTIPFENSIAFIEANPLVKVNYQNITIASQLIGAYNYSNIAIAITLGHYFKVAPKDIQSAIEEYLPANNRSQIITQGTNTIILDAYNANPSSMQVALENFKKLKAVNKLVILGDMFELGSESQREHQAIVDLIDSLNFEHCWYVGEHFYKTKTTQHKFQSYADLADYIQSQSLKEQTFLIKGSRGMRLERVVAFIS
jgi:UDP-N-acetylmuramoyl-tripeptide--D-alanyl-D-alanine ligase